MNNIFLSLLSFVVFFQASLSEITAAQKVVGDDLQLVFCCQADNDLYQVVSQSWGVEFPRYDDPVQAINEAPQKAGVLLLAEGYPDSRVEIDAGLFKLAASKELRLYVEYPQSVPGVTFDETTYVATGPYGTVLQRTVIASDLFQPEIDPMRIVMVNDCHCLPVDVPAEKSHLYLARVVGYDRAVFGLPEEKHSLLFEWGDRNVLISTTKLSHFVTGRYAPAEAWGPIWKGIFQFIQPGKEFPDLKWTATVRTSFAKHEELPVGAEREAFEQCVEWYKKSRLLVSEDWDPWDPNANPGIRKIPKQWRVGDGSHGIAECYIAKRMFMDGSQSCQPSIRADCTSESAMGLATGAKLLDNDEYRDIAINLQDFLWRKANVSQGPRADPNSPSYGQLGHNTAYPGVTHYWGDDHARALLGLITSSGMLETDRWDDAILRTALANFRLTGPKGFHQGGLISHEALEGKGWEFYWNWEGTEFSPHYQAYIWSVYLWLYDKTGFEPLLERTRTGMQLMMDAYPDRWSAECGRMEEERAHMLLPLAWLVRVEDTPEHREWLATMAQFVFNTIDESGAIPQMVDTPYHVNEQYGTSEAPIVYQTGDPATDMLYTMNFAFIGMHEAAEVTGEQRYAQVVDKMAEFMVRSQTQSENHPELSGTWYRTFDFNKWDYWGSDGDAGWGAWTTESGWTHSWITTTLGLREMKTSLWEVSKNSKVDEQFDEWRRRMLPDRVLIAE